MKKNKTRYLYVVIILGFLVFLSIPISYLSIESLANKIFFVEKVNVGDRLQLHSIHSASSTPLEKTLFVGENQTIILQKVKFFDQTGAGLPELAKSPEDFYIEENGFVIDNMQRSFTIIGMQVDELYENQLTIHGKNISLFDFFSSKKGSVEIKIKKNINVIYILDRLRSKTLNSYVSM